jgi:hypothetical protein
MTNEQTPPPDKPDAAYFIRRCTPAQPSGVEVLGQLRELHAKLVRRADDWGTKREHYAHDPEKARAYEIAAAELFEAIAATEAALSARKGGGT